MAVLTRKISRAKWEASEDLDEGEIQADAVSADLRTSGNTPRSGAALRARMTPSGGPCSRLRSASTESTLPGLRLPPWTIMASPRRLSGLGP